MNWIRVLIDSDLCSHYRYFIQASLNWVRVECVCVTLVDSLRAIEIEKCKKDIAEIRQQMYTAHKKSLDYAMLRWRRASVHLIIFCFVTRPICGLCGVKLAFHDADTDTDSDSNTPTSLRPTRAISSRGSSRGSRCRCMEYELKATFFTFRSLFFLSENFYDCTPFSFTLLATVWSVSNYSCWRRRMRG